MVSFRAVRAALIGLALLAWSRPAAAQQAEVRVRWTIDNPKVGFCLHFLMKPEAAAKDLVRGQRLVLARDVAGLPGAVSRLLTDQPEYAEWVPSQLCVLYPEAVWVDKKRFDEGDGGDHLALAIWGVASVGDHPALSIRTLASNSAALKRAMEAVLIPVDRVDLSVNPISESEDERYILKLEGGVVTMDGQARTDSVTVENIPFPSRAALRGFNNTLWSVDIDLKPTRIGALPGALRIQGKRGLADALLSSPVRFVDKVIAGGTGEIRFVR